MTEGERETESDKRVTEGETARGRTREIESETDRERERARERESDRQREERVITRAHGSKVRGFNPAFIHVLEKVSWSRPGNLSFQTMRWRKELGKRHTHTHPHQDEMYHRYVCVSSNPTKCVGMHDSHDLTSHDKLAMQSSIPFQQYDPNPPTHPYSTTTQEQSLASTTQVIYSVHIIPHSFYF